MVIQSLAPSTSNTCQDYSHIKVNIHKLSCFYFEEIKSLNLSEILHCFDKDGLNSYEDTVYQTIK